MKIHINGYKNIDNLDYEIEENKTNLLIGLCGSGKSTIGDAVLHRLNDENFIKFNYNNNPLIDIKYADGLDKKTAFFDSTSIEKYVFLKNSINDSYKLLVDTDDNDLLNEFEKLETISKKLKETLENSKAYFVKLKETRDKLGGPKLTQKGGLSKTTTIMKAKTAFEKAQNQRIYEHIDAIETNHFKWIIEGKKFIQDNHCPFCDKILNKKRLKLIRDYSNFDNKIVGALKLNDDDKKMLKIKVIKTKSQIDRMIDEVISISKAVSDYESIERYVINMKSLGLEYEFKEIELSPEFYKWFPNFKPVILKLNSKVTKISEIHDKVFKRTKFILSRKLKDVNELIKKLGLKYKIECNLGSNNTIESYKIEHFDDETNKDSSFLLSQGEKVIISLVLFLFEHKKSDAQVIVIDDPVSSFDDVRRGIIFYKIVELLKTKTVLVLSHDEVFAKYAINEKYCGANNLFKNDLGNIDFIFNDDGQVTINPIEKNDVNAFASFALSHLVNDNVPEIVKYLTIRIISDALDSEDKNVKKIFRYFSNIVHFRLKSEWKYTQAQEEKVISLVKQYLNYDIETFNDDFYKIESADKLCFFDKAIIYRSLLDTAKATKDLKDFKSQLNDLIHLNSRYIVCLNPYKYCYMNSFFYNKINDYFASNSSIDLSTTIIS